MSKSIKILLAVSLAAFVAGCAQEEEVIFVEELVQAEPVSNKY